MKKEKNREKNQENGEQREAKIACKSKNKSSALPELGKNLVESVKSIAIRKAGYRWSNILFLFLSPWFRRKVESCNIAHNCINS